MTRLPWLAGLLLFAPAAAAADPWVTFEGKAGPGKGKHVVLVNAELDSTVGPILKFHAERAGVVLTNTD